MAIPGTTSTAHLDEDLATLTLDIPTDALAAVDALFTFEAVSGPRYAKGPQAQIDTETWDGEPLE